MSRFFRIFTVFLKSYVSVMKFCEFYVPRIEAHVWECELGDMICRVLCLGNLQRLPAKTYVEEGG